MESWAKILIATLGSGSVLCFFQFMINRHDQRKGKFSKLETMVDKIQKRLSDLERDTTRLQLLLLIKMFPNYEMSITRVADKYFKDLNGNSYMMNLYERYKIEKEMKK